MVNRMVLAAALSVALVQVAAARSPVGLWSTEDKGGVVQILPCGGDLCGVIVGLTPSPQGVMPRDYQGGPQCHRTLLSGLVPQDDGRWHGIVTNPEDGHSYDAEVWVGDDGNMRLHGYIGLPLLGSTQVWPPFHGPVHPDCHFR